MSNPNTYGDPSNVTSWIKGKIPTIVDAENETQANRNTVVIVGRSLVSAETLNANSNAELGDNVINKDQYIYFYLVDTPLASSKDNINTADQIAEPSVNTMLAFTSNILSSNQKIVEFVVTNSTDPQSVNLKPLLKDLTYLSLESGFYEPASTGPNTSMFLVPQKTESVTIYSLNDDKTRLSLQSEKVIEETPAPNLPKDGVYSGVWYKAYSKESDTVANLWHVVNPFINSGDVLNGTKLDSTNSSMGNAQLGSFTGGGSLLPAYLNNGTANPTRESILDNPVALEIYDSKTPLTSQDYINIIAAINDVGNTLDMQKLGMSEMEFMLLPVQASGLYSSQGLGCFITQNSTSILEAQAFITTPPDLPITFTDIALGEITALGCTTKTSTGFLNSFTDKKANFNACIFTDSNDCSTDNEVNGYSYQYCTGSEVCGENNCFGECKQESGKDYIQCVRDYNFSETSTDSTYWSCDPVTKNNPSNVNGSGGCSNIVWILIIAVISIILLLVIFIFFWIYIRRRAKKNST